jgi:hypothetical protein
MDIMQKKNAKCKNARFLVFGKENRKNRVRRTPGAFEAPEENCR